LTDYQTVSRGLDDLSRDSVKLVYVEHSFDLGEDSGQEAKVAASHSNQLCDDLWWELLIRKFNAYRGPALLQEPLHLDRIECAEFVNEANSGVELRESSYALLDSRMPIRTIPALPSSKMDRICSRLFICSLSASSMMMSVVGSGIVFLRAS
jgi:hypothetical protein